MRREKGIVMAFRLPALVLFAALAVPSAAAAAAAPAPDHRQIEIPPELTDPEFVDKITGMTEALSKALLNLPVGGIEAAAQGRPVTDSDRNRTVSEMGKISERDLERKIAEARPQLRSAMQALSRTLPAMTKALSELADQVERATANLPQPGYPRP
jgi:hypothetical protein